MENPADVTRSGYRAHQRARETAEQITGFVNNIGLGVQFAAVGAKVFEAAKEKGLGREVPLDWFTQDVHP